VIPQTLATVVTFFAFIAPGLLWNIRRERREQALQQTAFREAGQTALVSTVFTALSSLALVGLGQVRPGLLPDFGALLTRGSDYVAANIGSLLVAALIEVALACGLAVTVEAIDSRRRSLGGLTDLPFMFRIFREQRPQGTTPWLRVRTKDGTDFWGYVGSYTLADKPADGQIQLVGPKLTIREKGEVEAPGADKGDRRELDQWGAVTLSGEQIAWISVTYVDDTTGDVVPRIAP